MKFNLTTAGHFYTSEDAKKLKEFGFKFDDEGYDKRLCKRQIFSDVEVEINSLEELIAFSNKWGELIVSDGSIIIYDDYCE